MIEFKKEEELLVDGLLKGKELKEIRDAIEAAHVANVAAHAAAEADANAKYWVNRYEELTNERHN